MPADQLDFCTNARPPGLLGACTASREVFLKTHKGVIQSKGHKIRFDPENDTILLDNFSSHGRRGYPGFQDMPETVPNYTTIFADVKLLGVLSGNIENSGKRSDRLNHRSCRCVAFFLSQFSNVQTLSMISHKSEKIEEFLARGNELRLRTWEESMAMSVLSVELFLAITELVDEGIMRRFKRGWEDYRREEKPNRRIPEIKLMVFMWDYGS